MPMSGKIEAMTTERKMAVFRGPAGALHPLLCLPQCLSAVLLPHLFRG